MSTLSAAATRPGNANARAGSRLPRWWPLAAITLLAAALRLSTIDLQSFWYDEAFTPVHVLHASLISTLRSVVHTENTPPLWYVLEWADARVLGDGPVALRLPSALAGIAIVPVAWGIGRELAGRRAAVVCASIVAVNPLFVWYSQEARAYSLFALAAAVAMLCFLRARRSGTPRAMTAFAISGAVALLTHYFALFLLIPMVALLVLPPPIGPNDRAHRRAALPAVAALAAVGAALIPLISAQGGHGTQWIGRWPIGERLQAIPQYFLTGYSGAPLGHGVELLVALPLLAAVGLGLWRMLEAGGGDEDAGRSRPAAVVALVIAAGGVLTPVVLVAFGADYLAPRNLLGAMIPVAALIAVLAVAPRPGALSTALVATMLAAFLVVSLDVDLSPRLQRGNWRDVAAALRAASPRRALTTVELGAAPLEYYLGGLHNLHRGTSVRVDEIDETGYAPLRASAGSPPAPGFRLFAHLDVDGLVVYRFRSSSPRKVSESTLRRHVITLAHPEVLVDPRFTR